MSENSTEIDLSTTRSSDHDIGTYDGTRPQGMTSFVQTTNNILAEDHPVYSPANTCQRILAVSIALVQAMAEAEEEVDKPKYPFRYLEVVPANGKVLGNLIGQDSHWENPKITYPIHRIMRYTNEPFYTQIFLPYDPKYISEQTPASHQVKFCVVVQSYKLLRFNDTPGYDQGGNVKIVVIARRNGSFRISAQLINLIEVIDSSTLDDEAFHQMVTSNPILIEAAEKLPFHIDGLF
jgi:hypothetical protein